MHRFLANVDLDKIRALIENIPESLESLTVMPGAQKEFYLRLLEIRLYKLHVLVRNDENE